MSTAIFPKLPNPTLAQDPQWEIFDQYLVRNGITPVQHPALRSYQHSAEGRFLSAHELNHCLTLVGAGTRYASYATGGDSAEERLGSLEVFTDPNGQDYEYSKTELDLLFETHGVRFDAASVVYKGVGNDEFYEYLNLSEAIQGDVIQFHGFLSTSVCRSSAERFAKSRVLLVISNIDRIRALVPPNEAVLNGLNGEVPEQEILLDRQQRFTVRGVKNLSGREGWLREISLEATQ